MRMAVQQSPRRPAAAPVNNHIPPAAGPVNPIPPAADPVNHVPVIDAFHAWLRSVGREDAAKTRFTYEWHNAPAAEVDVPDPDDLPAAYVT